MGLVEETITNLVVEVSFATLQANGSMSGRMQRLAGRDVGTICGLVSNWQDRGIAKLLVESDFKVLVDMLARRGDETDTHYALARRIKRLLTRDWEVQIVHTWREGNMCADWLVVLCLQNDSLDTTILEEPSEALSHFIIDDIAGRLCLGALELFVNFSFGH